MTQSLQSDRITKILKQIHWKRPFQIVSEKIFKRVYAGFKKIPCKVKTICVYVGFN